MSDMATIRRKNKNAIDMKIEDAQCATAHGGQLIIDALAREFGLWKKIDAIEDVLDVRRDKSRGFAPGLIIFQIITSLCSGGVSLADAGRLGGDKALGRLLGVERWADESTIGEWLRGQTPAGLNAVWGVNREFCEWILKKVKPGYVRHGGKLEVFFDDTQIEVGGRKFEGTGCNYNGDLAYSWQTLWVGPFLADGHWSAGNVDVSGRLGECLENTASIWENDAKCGRVLFYADSGSSAGKYLNLLDNRGWNWSVSYNKWTDKLDVLAADMKDEKDWSKPSECVRRGESIVVQYGWIKHLPGKECERTQTFAVVRYRNVNGGELLWRYSYVVGGGSLQQKTHEPEAARLVFERHNLKGAKEQGFYQLLGEMDLHHPPCLASHANAFFYALSTIAFNLLTGVKLLYMEDDKQAWSVKTLIRFWLTVPVKISTHAHRTKARVFVPKACLRWWRLFLVQHYPKRKPGWPCRDATPDIDITSD